MQSLSMHIMDLVQNSLDSGANYIGIEIKSTEKELFVSVEDNGCAMDKEEAEKAFSPFFTTNEKRKIGMGLPLLKENAEKTGGFAKIQSQKNKGTRVSAVFLKGSIDCISLGDTEKILAVLAVTNPKIDFKIKLESEKNEIIFDTRKIRKDEKDFMPLSFIKELTEYFKTAQLRCPF